MPDYEQKELIESITHFNNRRRRLKHTRYSYQVYLFVSISLSISGFLFYLYISDTRIEYTFIAFLLFLCNFYCLWMIYKLFKILRYETISVQEFESRIISEYGYYFDLRNPGDILSYMQLMERMNSRALFPEKGILLVVLLTFSISSGLLLNWAIKRLLLL